jgi:hypothetical protein
MADFEADVPQHVEDLLDPLVQGDGEAAPGIGHEEHDIHITEGVQFATAVATQGHECQQTPVGGIGQRVDEEVAEDDVHQARALPARLPAAAAALVLQQDSMFLDLEELLVERNELGSFQFTLRGELLLGVGEDFFAMSE